MYSLVKTYLIHTNHSSSINAFEDSYYSHPNFPSLLAITDGLALEKIENIAANIPFVHFADLPNTFITELGIDEKKFYLLQKKGLQVIITDEKHNSRVIALDEIEKIWTGIVLIIEESKKLKLPQSSNFYAIPSALLFIGIVIIKANSFSFITSLFLFISLFGVFLSIEISKLYFNDDKATESKFCNISKEFSCSKTIKSKKYLLSKYIEFVDLPIIFFGFTMIGIIFSIVSLSTIGLLSSLSIPIVFYSIYIQKKELQNWCVLCLLISLTLIANSIFFWYFQLELSFITLNELLLCLFSASLWFYLKKYVMLNNDNKRVINKLLRFKRNDNVFNAISIQVKEKEELESLPKITIGSMDTPNTLTLFLSPSCPHCHTAFIEALNLLENHGESIKIEICYNLNINNYINPYLDIAKTIMKLFNQNKNFKLALVDWHIGKLSIADWKKKWCFDDDFIVENEQLEKQLQWCIKNNFYYAPVKIFNGKLMSEDYEIKELFYFFVE